MKIQTHDHNGHICHCTKPEEHWQGKWAILKLENNRLRQRLLSCNESKEVAKLKEEIRRLQMRHHQELIEAYTSAVKSEGPHNPYEVKRRVERSGH